MRKTLFTLSVFAFAAGLLADPGSLEGPSPDEALARLKGGNARYVAGGAHARRTGGERRGELAQAQHPFAAVLSCSDSRVPPEHVFDQGLGDLFVVRDAGNVDDAVVEGSMEYAVDHLNVPLLVVLGHERCGAVDAAVNAWRGHDGHPSPNLQAIMDKLEPAIQVGRTFPGDLAENAMVANAKQTAFNLGVNPVMRRRINAGALKVLAARYDLDSGKVTFYEPDQAKAGDQ